MPKNLIYAVSLFLSISILACQQVPNRLSDETAIKEVVEKSLHAAKHFDYDAMADIWAHEPYVALIRPQEGNIVGWESLGAWYKKTFSKYQRDRNGFLIKELTASNYDMDIHGNISYVTYDEYTWAVLAGQDYSGKYKVIKYLERMDGQWKIIVSGKRGEATEKHLEKGPVKQSEDKKASQPLD